MIRLYYWTEKDSVCVYMCVRARVCMCDYKRHECTHWPTDTHTHTLTHICIIPSFYKKRKNSNNHRASVGNSRQRLDERINVSFLSYKSLNNQMSVLQKIIQRYGLHTARPFSLSWYSEIVDPKIGSDDQPVVFFRRERRFLMKAVKMPFSSFKIDGALSK